MATDSSVPQAPRLAPHLLCARHLPPAPARLGLGCGLPVSWLCVHTGLPATTVGPAAAGHERCFVVVFFSVGKCVLSRAAGGVAQLFGCYPPTCHPATRDDDLLPHMGQLDPEVSLEEDETTALETSGTFPKHEPQSN